MKSDMDFNISASNFIRFQEKSMNAHFMSSNTIINSLEISINRSSFKISFAF